MTQFTKHSFSALACILLMLATAFGQGEGRAAFLEAEKLRQANRCDEAIRKYDEAIAKERSNYKYYFSRGKCEMKLKQMDKAKESLKTTAQFKPDYTPAYSLLAKIYKDERDFDQATFYYGEAARNERDPKKKVQYKLLLINLLIKTEKTDEARIQIAETKEIDPTNPNILYYEAEMYAADGNWNAAKANYDLALGTEEVKTLPLAAQAKYFYGLGTAQMNLGDIEGAKRSWAKANVAPYNKLIKQQLLKTNHVHFYKIAASYYLSNEFIDCEDYLGKALEIQKEFSPAYVLQAKMASKQGNFQQAVELYKRAIQAEGDPKKQAGLHAQVATLQLNNNDSYGALASAEKAIAGGISSPALLLTKARAEYMAQQNREAIATLELLLPSAANDAKAKAKYSFMIGMAAKKLGDVEKANLAFKNALFGPYKPAAKEEMDRLKESTKKP